jgi:hypothetical protein
MKILEESKKLRIGVRIRDWGIELLDGRPLPPLAMPCVAELVISPDSLVNPADRFEFSNERSVPFLSKDTELMLGVSPNCIGSESPKEHLIRPEDLKLNCEFFLVQVVLETDLFLRIRGDGEATLDQCKCFIPALDKHVKSVNIAFTRISEVFESLRLSHTGNVFLRGFARASEDRWSRLDELRTATIRRYMEQRAATAANRG